MNWLIVILAIIYVVSPLDLVPDVSLLGRIDDVLLVLYLYWRFRRARKAAAVFDKHGPEERASQPKRPAADATVDPYRVLGVPRNASFDDIQTAYRRLVTQYHPDKVTHLGKEFQALAHEKMIAIQAAFEALNKDIH